MCRGSRGEGGDIRTQDNANRSTPRIQKGHHPITKSPNHQITKSYCFSPTPSVVLESLDRVACRWVDRHGFVGVDCQVGWAVEGFRWEAQRRWLSRFAVTPCGRCSGAVPGRGMVPVAGGGWSDVGGGEPEVGWRRVRLTPARVDKGGWGVPARSGESVARRSVAGCSTTQEGKALAAGSSPALFHSVSDRAARPGTGTSPTRSATMTSSATKRTDTFISG